MTDRERAAFHAGLAHAACLAQIAAVSLEVRDDARHLRQRAAIEALRGLADGLKAQANGEGDVSTSPSAGPKGTHETRTFEGGATETGIPASLSDQRHAAIASGYSGDACTNCQNFTLRHSGTCLSCDTCGSTTGCS